MHTPSPEATTPARRFHALDARQQQVYRLIVDKGHAVPASALSFEQWFGLCETLTADGYTFDPLRLPFGGSIRHEGRLVRPELAPC